MYTGGAFTVLVHIGTDFLTLVVMPSIFGPYKLQKNCDGWWAFRFLQLRKNVIGFYLASPHLRHNASERKTLYSSSSTALVLALVLALITKRKIIF